MVSIQRFFEKLFSWEDISVEVARSLVGSGLLWVLAAVNELEIATQPLPWVVASLAIMLLLGLVGAARRQYREDRPDIHGKVIDAHLGGTGPGGSQPCVHVHIAVANRGKPTSLTEWVVEFRRGPSSEWGVFGQMFRPETGTLPDGTQHAFQRGDFIDERTVHPLTTGGKVFGMLAAVGVYYSHELCRQKETEFRVVCRDAWDDRHVVGEGFSFQPGDGFDRGFPLLPTTQSAQASPIKATPSERDTEADPREPTE